MFQLKNWVSITASMGNYMQSVTTKITDFRVGSIFRTIMESAAAEMDELYQQIFIGLTEAIPVSIYQAFNFPALPAKAASGNIAVTIAAQTSAVLIPAGTVFTISGAPTGYASQQDATIPVGSTSVAIFVAAVATGPASNIPSGQSFTAQPTISGFISATNLAPFNTGVNAETPAEQQLRFSAYIAALQHGTVAAVNYGLTLGTVLDSNGNIIEYVTAKNLIEQYYVDGTTGVLNCYIFNGSSGASSQLIANTLQIINGYYTSAGVAVPGYKAAGIVANVYAATVSNLTVTGTPSFLANYDPVTTAAAAASNVANYLTGLDLGGTAVLAEIITVIMNTPGISNISLSAPTTDTMSAANVKIMPGPITL